VRGLLQLPATQQPATHAMRIFRRAITSLRMEGHPVCGLPETGYFWGVTDAEIIETCEWLYARAKTTWQQIAAMRKAAAPDFRRQLNLPEGESS